MKKSLLLTLVFCLSLLFSPSLITAQDVCCLPGFVPLNDGCVNTMVAPACDAVSIGICASTSLTMTLCQITDVEQIISDFCQVFVQSADVFTADGFCSGLLDTFGIADLTIYDSCRNTLDGRFGILGDLVGNVTTNNLCTFGSENRFYFCYPNGDVNQRGIPTALGCVPTDLLEFITGFVQWSVGIGAVVNLLVIIYSSVLFITGGHDPKKVQSARETLTASLAGLVFILLCIVFINYIGDTLLNLGPLGFRQ